MAEFIPLRCNANFKLLAGTNPETGKPIYKTDTVSGADPLLNPNSLKVISGLLAPCLDYPISETRLSRAELVE